MKHNGVYQEQHSPKLLDRAWVFYKESSWIKRLVLVFRCYLWIHCFALQFFKLSPEESLKDPIYFVLAKHQNDEDAVRHTTGSSVVIAKVFVTVMGCYILGLIIYAFAIDGFPFYVELLTPCMITALIDVSIHIVVFSVWIAYKESSWTSAVFWIILLVCFSGIGICVYIVRELFYLSPGEPVSLILFNKRNRVSYE
ncbi:hypothetical protein Hdeb2414_s0003g00082701 [Helianthus debilis subsp. tardiflorus]